MFDFISFIVFISSWIYFGMQYGFIGFCLGWMPFFIIGIVIVVVISG